MQDLGFYPGDKVRIIRGAFAGFTAVVRASGTSTFPRKQGELIVVETIINGRGTPVEVLIEDLEPDS